MVACWGEWRFCGVLGCARCGCAVFSGDVAGIARGRDDSFLIETKEFLREAPSDKQTLKNPNESH